jgi:hypothetical protein
LLLVLNVHEEAAMEMIDRHCFDVVAINRNVTKLFVIFYGEGGDDGCLLLCLSPIISYLVKLVFRMVER